MERSEAGFGSYNERLTFIFEAPSFSYHRGTMAFDMEFSRRTVLAATGAAGAGTLGVGYWQRRRLVRFSELSDLRDIAAIEVPRIEDDPVITMPLLKSAYDRAVVRFDEIEARLDPPFDRYSEGFVEDLRDHLTEEAPDRVTISPWVPSYGAPAMHAARRQALSIYHIRRSRLVSVLAHNSPEELPPEAFEEQSTTVRERLESLTVPYRGGTLGEAIMSGATIEWAIGRAEHRLEGERGDDDYPAQWRDLERATAAVQDAESFVQARDGSDYSDDLPMFAERVVNEFEHRRAEAPERRVQNTTVAGNHVPSFATSAIGAVQRSMRLLGASPSGRHRLLEGGNDGRAVLTHALLLPTVPLYEAFTDVPHIAYWAELDYELGATSEELRAEKTATIDAVEPYLEADDPLVAHLATVPLGVVRAADSRLQTLIEDVGTLDDAEWAIRRDQALLQYESARRYAETIDDTIDTLSEMSHL